ncbi:MAG: hypothetical protein OHK0037_21690 [Elainellaceae cyanobacterium]
MGLIKKLLGGLFSFLSGLGKLLGLGKSSEYFLEAEPSNSAAPAAPAAVASPKAPAAAAAPVAAVAVAEPPATDVTTNGKAPAAVAPVPSPAPAAKPVAEAAPAAEQTFAPNFVLMNSNRGGRRRPGPSLNPFLDMARQVRPQG